MQWSKYCIYMAFKYIYFLGIHVDTAGNVQCSYWYTGTRELWSVVIRKPWRWTVGWWIWECTNPWHSHDSGNNRVTCICHDSHVDLFTHFLFSHILPSPYPSLVCFHQVGFNNHWINIIKTYIVPVNNRVYPGYFAKVLIEIYLIYMYCTVCTPFN